MYRVLEGCPKCGHFKLRESIFHGMWERLRHRLTGKRPFRCRGCGWRGWADESWDRRQRLDEAGQRLGRRAEDRR
jgi:hypothetical protein